MDILSEWVRTMAVAAVFCAAVLTLAPEGNGKHALRLVCALVLTILFLRPLAGLREDGLAEHLARQRLLSRELLRETEELSIEVCRRLIRENTEEYIWSAATEIGISRLGIRLTLRDGEELPYPYSIELRGTWTEEQKTELSRLLAGELGIPKLRQSWSMEDAD